MNKLLSQKIMWAIFLFVLAGGVYFLFSPSDDTQYLKKTTLQIINLIGPMSSSSDFALLRRQQEIGKSIHVGVHFKFSVFQYKFENRSLEKLRALLSDYFKYSGKNAWKWHAPEEEELFVEFIPRNESLKTSAIEEEPHVNENVKSSQEQNKELFTEQVSKVAKMEFPINVTNASNKSTSCTTELYWVKEDRWFIKKIHIFNCSSL